MKSRHRTIVIAAALPIVAGATLFGFLQADPTKPSKASSQEQPEAVEQPAAEQSNTPEKKTEEVATKPAEPEKKKSSPEAQKFYNDLLTAPVLSSSEIINRIKKCSVEVTVGAPLDDAIGDVVFRSAAIDYLRKKGIKYDEKAPARLKITVQGNYQKRISGRYVIFASLHLPALHFHEEKVWMTNNMVSLGVFNGNVMQQTWANYVDKDKTEEQCLIALKYCLDGNGHKPDKQIITAADNRVQMHGFLGGKDFAYDFYRKNLPYVAENSDGMASLGERGWNGSEITSINVHVGGHQNPDKKGIKEDMAAAVESLGIKTKPYSGQHLEFYVLGSEQWRFEKWVYNYGCMWYLHYDHAFFCLDGQFLRAHGMQLLGTSQFIEIGKHSVRNRIKSNHHAYIAQIVAHGRK